MNMSEKLFGKIAAVLLVMGCLLACESNGSDRLRFHRAADSNGAPCLDWRGVNRCAPEQSVGPERGHWQRSDLMLPPIRTTALPDPQGKGAQALVRYCSACHNLPAPGMHAAADWKPVVSRMRDRMAQAARYGQVRNEVIPGDRDVALVERYLTENALAAIGVHELPEPTTVEAGLFRGYCSVCHALPKPSAQPRRAWASITERMFRYLANSQPGRSTKPGAREAVTRYLERHARKEAR